MEHPQYGLDPDVYMVEPPPPEGAELMSLLLWQPGHVAPKLAVEIVSPGHPTKDYVIAPEKYAVSGVGELWILDARLEGPSKKGGPYAIQVWRRQEEGLFAQVYAGAGPAWSPAVQGFIQLLQDSAWYALSTDREGAERWLTEKEAAQRQAQAAQRQAQADRAAREAAQRQAQADRAAREEAEQQVKAAERRAAAAERRIQELEALLARGR
ncbi:MAG: Uma2 family endonuclease [Polyangiaceae bacterium]|nr:Uma2 family endonuclease [Polyangiaceae bacterium]